MAPICIDKFMGSSLYITCIAIVYIYIYIYIYIYMLYAIAKHIYFNCIIIYILLF